MVSVCAGGANDPRKPHLWSQWVEVWPAGACEWWCPDPNYGLGISDYKSLQIWIGQIHCKLRGLKWLKHDCKLHDVSCCSFFPPVWQHPCVGWIVRIQLDSWVIWVDDPGVLQEGCCEASSTTGGLRGVLGFAVCGIGGASRRRHFCWPIVRLRMSASWSSSMTLGREKLATSR